MTSTQIKKLNAYPEWNSPITYEQVLHYIQSINEEEEEPQYPPNLTSQQKTRYRQKFSQDFIVEPLHSQLTIFYQPHIQGQENQRIKIPVARPNQHQEILEQIYNDDKLGLGTGLDQFYYQVCSQYIGIKRIEARAFLRKQGNYQITRPIHKVINQPILSKTPNEIWGMDITYMNYLQVKTKKNEQGVREPREINPRTFGVMNVENKLTENLNQFNDDGTKGYILTIVDFFSKYVWARALRRMTAEYVLQAFESVCNETNTYPHILITDNGKEFTNQNMKQYCKDHQIQQRVATSYKPTTNGLAERMNREIKKKIKAGFVRNNNLEWVSHLQTYCDNINNQRQSTTGYKPIELWKPLYQPVNRTRLPDPDLKPNDFSNDKELRQRIESRITNKAKAILATQKAHQYQVGDYVRVKLIAIDSKYRKRNKDGKWEKKKTAIHYSPRLYRISKVLRKTEAQGQKYYLDLLEGENPEDNNEWRPVGKSMTSRNGREYFKPYSFYSSDLWYVPVNNVSPTVQTKTRADIINFFKPYPPVNQAQLDEEERQRQEEERQQQEQLRLEREERQRVRQQEEEERVQRRLQRQIERQQREREQEEHRQHQEETRQQRLEEEREKRLRQLEEQRRRNQQYEKTTRTGRTVKPSSRYV